MKTQIIVIFGGIIPAVLWGLATVFQKMSALNSIGPGRYLTVFGVVVAAGGIVYAQLTNEVGWSSKGLIFTVAAGFAFTVGAGLLSFVLWRYEFPISRLAPILGANVLVTVLVGVMFMGEGANLNVPQLMVGTLIVIVGMVVVTAA